jgi:hypothetical protein
MPMLPSSGGLFIKEVLYQAEFGGTKPVFIRASDGEEYLLKFRASDQGMDVSIFNEYLGYMLADLLGYNISPQRYGILHIDTVGLDVLVDAYRNGIICDEALHYAGLSIGPNFAVEKINDVVKADDITNKRFSSEVRELDSLILNRDRYKENTNILKSLKSTQYFAIDYGLAMLESRVYEAIEDGIYGKYAMPLRQCHVTDDSRYILRHVTQRPKKANPSQLRDMITAIVDSMPQEWEPVKHRDEIADLISTRAGADVFKNGPCPFELF